jgi:hypothetical protein
MLRTRIVTASALALVLMIAPSVGRGEPQEAKKDEKVKDDKGKKEQPQEVKQNEKFKGELKGKKESVRGYDVEAQAYVVHECYRGEVLIALEAAQSLSLSVSVHGDERKVLVWLYDPQGDEIVKTSFQVGTARIDRKEVPASGKYKIVIRSPHSGAFTLLAKGPSKDESDEKVIDERIKELKKELADLEAKREALKKKKDK